MKGYIYTMYQGADPGRGWILNDPIFGKYPTLGACVPNIRRAVEIGDYLFFVSGRIPSERQFVVGGFKVKEKISALAAYRRFPENRIHRHENGQILGNVIVDASGKQHPDDKHTNFARRVENYIVGGNPVVLESDVEILRSRNETLPVLEQIFGKQGNRVFDVIGRHRRLNESQVGELLSWLEEVKGAR